ncbi:aminoglycoside phosphotransferase family protein [Rossellomorea sp. RS05]|uniref:phosphotransferase family protein n=1 Tax=Rossellomorea TaxID=2837508 RepID=UPI001C446FC4|nr:aminoglycoside phosphotransferase family protein [Bacillus sp. JRC01]
MIEKIESLVGPILRHLLLEEQGCTSEVSRIETGEGTFILKKASLPRYRNWLKKEAQVLQRVQGYVAVPGFIGFWESERDSYLLMEYIEGISLTSALKRANDGEERLVLIRSFGDFLHRFHERAPLVGGEKGDWLERVWQEAEPYVRAGETDGDKALLEQLKEERPASVNPTMIHGDCNPDNVLVVDGEVNCLIDVSGMTVGDPRYDESLAIGKFTGEERDAFYEGYKRYRVSDEEFTYFYHGMYELF